MEKGGMEVQKDFHTSFYSLVKMSEFSIKNILTYYLLPSII